jgi:polyvinyl alcohol dehydrogenase (cytochrome)
MKYAFAVFFLATSSALAQTPDAGRCRTTPALTDPASGPRWNGWGAAVTNTRFQAADQAKLSASDVPKLKLKWAFGIPNVMQARSQARGCRRTPVHGERFRHGVCAGSENRMHVLDV